MRGLDKSDVALSRCAFLRCLELLYELFEGCHQVLNQLELVVIHVWWKVEIALLWAHSVELNRVLVRNQGILLAMQEKDWALSLSYQVNIAEAFIDNHCQEGGPAKQAFGCVFDRHVGRHQQE